MRHANLLFILFLVLFIQQTFARDLILRDATVWTGATPYRIERTSILVRNGVIVEIGPNVRGGADAVILNLAGKHVTPGVIDVHSHMGASRWMDPNGDTNEMTAPLTPQVRIADSFDPYDKALLRAVAGGVTTVQILPGSGNVIGGQSAVYKLRGAGQGYATLYSKAPPGMKMASGENPKRVYGDRNQSPSTRMGNYAVLRAAFRTAQEYKAKHDAWAANPTGPQPDRDLRFEPLVEILEGRRLVHIHAYRQDEMLGLMKVADDFGFKIRSFQHGIEAYKLAGELARKGVAVSTWTHFFGSKMELYDGIPYNLSILADHGVLTTIHSDSFDTAPHLWNEGAVAIAHGLSPENAMRSLTINGAKVLGVDQHTGSIEIGKEADFAIFDGEPFNGHPIVEMTIVDGEVVFDRSRDWAVWNQRIGGRP
jgi:imidazolonepropionase-like amidohydrolase